MPQHAQSGARRLRRAAWITGGVAAFLGLVIFVLPSPLARWAIGSQLEALGVRHEGLGTVEVDLWNSAFRAGPILMRGGADDPARLGAVDASYSLSNLFQRRAFIETFTLSGVDIHVRRARDGAITVNGVAPPAAAPEPERETAAATGEGFGYGVSTFVFTEGLLVLEDYSGGTLTLALDRLELSDFRSWEPETPGRYVLSATLNDMAIRAEGEATPFADMIRATGDIAMTDLTLDGVAAFVGPTGLAEQQGRYALNLRHDARLTPDGALAITLTGDAGAADVALRTEAGEAVAIAALDKTFDATVAIASDNAATVTGAVQAVLRDLALTAADGGRAVLSEATLALSDMNLRKSAELREGVAAAVEAAAVAEGDAAGTLVELALRGLSAITRETLRHELEGSASIALSARGAEIAGPDGASVTLAAAEASGEGVEVGSSGPLWRIAAPISVQLEGLDAAGGGGRARLDLLGLDVASFESRTDFETRDSRFDLSLTIEGFAGEGEGARGAVDSLSLRSDAITVSGALGAETVEGAVTIEAQALSGGASDAEARAASLAVALDALRFAAEGGAVSLSGGVDLTGLAAETPALSVAAPALRASLDGISATAAPFALSGAAALSGSGVTLTQPGGAAASLGGLEAHADALSLSPGETTVSGALALSNLSAQTESSATVDLALGAVESTGLSVAVSAGRPPAIGMDRLALSGLDATVAIAVFGAEGGSGGGSLAEGDASPMLRLGQVSISPGGSIVVLDSSAGEAVRVPIMVERLEAGPLDTAAPGAPTSIEAALAIADAARLTVSGSATPLSPWGDFDVAVDLTDFPLPLVSPYVTKMSGLTVESGGLDLQASGQATGGALSGGVHLRLAELYVGETDEETAARFQQTYGVPVGFAVGVLKDGDGVIALSLPVSGTVDAPEIDYSAVISKAIGGAIASLFPGGSFDGEAGFGIEPVPFAPGSAELDEAAAAALAPLIQALTARPDLRLRVCGKAARADLLALRGLDPEGPAPTDVTEVETQALLALAQARGGVLRDALAAAGVDGSRIGDCRTSYSVESDAPPRAEVQL